MELQPKVDLNVIGLDVGRAVDFSALCVLSRWYRLLPPDAIPNPEGVQAMYTIIEAYRFPLQTEYDRITEAVANIWERPSISTNRRICVVDHTGVGAPVVEMIRKRHVNTIGINITGGNAVTKSDERTFNIPKATLVTTLVQYFQSGRIKIAIDEPEAEELSRQLESFGYRIDRLTGHTSYESLEGKVHDDMVISVALALYWAVFQIPSLHSGMRRKPEIAPTHDPLGRD